MNHVNTALGVDIGGTHITAALIDLQRKTVIASTIKRASVNAAGTVEEIIESWSNCMREAKGDVEIESICIAIPGPFEYESGVSLMRGQDKYESLFELNVKHLLSKSLSFPAQQIFMDNDAACFLQGEVFGAIVPNDDSDTVVGITLGTGLGSAVYRHERSRNADMWCWPFKDGIAEDYLSTRWFVQRWKQLTGEHILGVKELTLKDTNNANVKIIFDEFAGNLEEFLSTFIEKESASAVVIGGNIAKAFDWFGVEVLKNLGRKFSKIKVEQAKQGEEAQLLGAVGSWLQRQKSALIV